MMDLSKSKFNDRIKKMKIEMGTWQTRACPHFFRDDLIEREEPDEDTTACCDYFRWKWSLGKE